jgi:cytochrome c553
MVYKHPSAYRLPAEILKTRVLVRHMRTIVRVALATVICTFAGSVWAQGDPAAGEQKATLCAACHGPAGRSSNPIWPNLAGQNERYLLKQLKDFKTKARQNALMEAQVVNLSDQDMADLAAYLSKQKPSEGTALPASLSSGQRIYRGGNLQTGVPACMGCHGPSGAGNALAAFPMLSGQHAPYAIVQLKAFKAGERSNDGDSKTMRGAVQNMSDAEIQAVAEYMSGLR